MTGRPPCFGVYEKALPAGSDWERKLACAGKAGYRFVELAVDDAAERLARLSWSRGQRMAMREAIANTGVPVRTVILSAHRRFPLGSATRTIREEALDLCERAIELAVDIGSRLVQLAGYFVYEEAHTPGDRERFLDGIRHALAHAAPAGVMLGLETMDGEDITSVADAMDVVRDVNSPWLQVYADLGNLAAQGVDLRTDLAKAEGHLVGVHLKDARPSEYRRIPFGDGVVPFTDAFRTLDRIGYDGPFVVEMWNEKEADPFLTIVNARNWLEQRIGEARA